MLLETTCIARYTLILFFIRTISHFHGMHAHDTITNLPEWWFVASRRLEQQSANCEQCRYYSECSNHDQQKAHASTWICGRYLDNEHPKEGVLSSLFWTWKAIRSIFILLSPGITSWKVWNLNTQLSKQMPGETNTPPFFQYKGYRVQILMLKEAKSLRLIQRYKLCMLLLQKNVKENYQTWSLFWFSWMLCAL